MVPDYQKAIEELSEGQEAAKKLEGVLIDPRARGLVGEVLSSISGAMAALEFAEAAHACQSPLIDSRRMEGPCKKRKVQQIGGGGRGGYRRRTSSQSLKKVTSKTMDDGFSWRKYGQKEIFGSKFPRSYFRCTHKQYRGCQAVRQVQQSEKDPSEFVITYIGDHTCTDPSTVSVISDHMSCLTSSKSIHATQRFNPPSSSPRSPKQEEATSSSSDFLTLSEMGLSEGLAPPPAAPIGGPVSDYGDETSGLTNWVNGLDLGATSHSFDDLSGGFGFDQDEFHGTDLGTTSHSFDDLSGGFGLDQDEFDGTFGSDYLDLLDILMPPS